MAKRMLPKPTTAMEMMLELSKLMTDESDRGCVLVAHGFIEAQLGELITRHLLRMSGARKLVRTLLESLFGAFRNRVNLARAMGLIEEPIASALLEFGKLRNKLAHEPRTVLDVGLVSKALNALDAFSRSLVAKYRATWPDFSLQRIQVMSVAAILISQLRLAINSDKRRLRIMAAALEPTAQRLPRDARAKKRKP